MIQSTKTLASFSNSKIAMENMEVFANAWVTQINDLSVLVKDVNDVCQGRSDRQVYLSLPRPGVSMPPGIERFSKDFLCCSENFKAPFLFFPNLWILCFQRHGANTRGLKPVHLSSEVSSSNSTTFHDSVKHHHHFNVHVLSKLIKGMDSCFPTAYGRQI